MHNLLTQFGFVEEDSYTKLAREYSSWNDHCGDLEDSYHGNSCYGYIMDGGFCIRANTMWDYCEANRQVQVCACMHTCMLIYKMDLVTTYY